MSTLRIVRFLLLTVAAAMMSSCGSWSIPLPREAYVDTIATFAKTTDQLSKAADVELTTYRTTARLHIMNVALTTHILDLSDPIFKLAPSSNSPQAPSTPQDVARVNRERALERILCAPREFHADLLAQRAYLGSVSSAMQRVAAPPGDSVIDLVKALGHSYRISVPAAGSAQEVRIQCQEDIAKYIDEVYPTKSKVEAAQFLAAAEALYAIYQQVILPLIRRGLQEVDSVRRAAALRSYILDTKNQQNLTSAMVLLGDTIRDGATARRHAAIKPAIDNINTLFSAISEANSTLTLTGTVPQECSGLTRSTNRDIRQDVAFQRCHKALWTRWEPKVTEILVASSAYDDEADKTADKSASELRGISAHLVEIANGKLDEASTRALFDTAVRWATLADDLQKAYNSADNRKKVTDALVQFKEALGAK